MRFADLDGTPIDVYQQNTNMNDEAGQSYPATVDALLDNAVGPNGYYGAFGVNMHNDYQAPHRPRRPIVAVRTGPRRARSMSYKQMLEWVDGRNASTIAVDELERRQVHVHDDRRARRHRAPDAAPGPGSDGHAHRRDAVAGRTVPFTRWTMKGIEYALLHGRHGNLPGALRLSR